MKGFFLVLAALILLSGMSFAETTCEKKDCGITIKIKIAFIGANDTYINNAENEIENVWNGPTGSRTFGDCKCRVSFDVETKKVTNQANCTPAIQGYHCVMVTPFFNAAGQYDNPPRNQTNITGAEIYVGYMYGIATGNGSNSQNGWWSDQMSRPAPGGGNYKDFAHEAGHMMGLEDGDGGIMNRTTGANSDPTQTNIDEIINDICGANACPDRCCCGNGQIEKDKGEQCDPKANPVGCASGQQCCAVCCSCYGPICNPSNNQYLTKSMCQARCGADATCYKNYKSGCWDCVKRNIIVTGTCRDSTNIRGNLECDHTQYGFGQGPGKVMIIPVVGGLFTDERMNIHVEGMGDGYAILQNGVLSDYGVGVLEDPSIRVYTDETTVSQLYSGGLSMNQAIKDDLIEMEGVGFFNSMKVGIHEFFFKLLTPDEDYELVMEEPYPQEYYEGLEFPEPAFEDTRPGLGDLPDLPYNR